MTKLTKDTVRTGMFIAGSACPVQVVADADGVWTHKDALEAPPAAAPRYGTPDLTEIRAKIAGFDAIGERMKLLKTKIDALKKQRG